MIRLPKIDNRQGQNILQAPKKKVFQPTGLVFSLETEELPDLRRVGSVTLFPLT